MAEPEGDDIRVVWVAHARVCGKQAEPPSLVVWCGGSMENFEGTFHFSDWLSEGSEGGKRKDEGNSEPMCCCVKYQRLGRVRLAAKRH